MNEHVEQSFAELLRRTRREAGLTQEELAARAGISTRAVSDLERAINRKPQLETFRLLADAIGLSDNERTEWNKARRRATSPVSDAPVTAQAPPRIPAPPTSFVGRSHDVDEIAGLLSQPSVRLVTITGPGGVGKTRVAIEAVNAFAGLTIQFPDGVWFANLAPIRDPVIALTRIAADIGVTISGRQSPVIALAAALRGTRGLLLLDNLEQIIGIGEPIAQFLLTCPGITILATSRAPLRIQGEHEYDVTPFVLPDDIANADLESLRRSAAVRLFEDRARGVTAAIRMTESDVRSIAAICQRVDGLPLAIELVAARVRALPPTTLLDRLDQRLALLAGASHDVPARHQTLRDTIAWSYDLLDPLDQCLFRALGIFQGGAALAAVEAIASHVYDELRLLSGIETLIAQSLVQMHEQADGTPRYSMLETIGEYAREQLSECDELPDIAQRHAQYFREFAVAAEPRLRGPEQALWMTKLEAEHANLLGAIEWLFGRIDLGDPDAVISCFRLASALWWFWYVKGYMALAQKHYARILHLLQTRQPAIQGRTGRTEWSRLYARALFLDAGFTIWRTDHNDDVAWRRMNKSLEIYRQLGQQADIAFLLMFHGYGSQRVGNYADAETYLTEGLEISRRLGDSGTAALALQGLAVVGLRRGDYERASHWATESLSFFMSLGDERGIAAARGTIGALCLRKDDLMQAKSLLCDSLRIRHHIGDRGGIAWCLEWLAELVLLDVTCPAGPLRAAHLLGAAAALRIAVDSPVDPVDLPDHERVVASVQAQLSDPAFVAAWEAGRALPVDAAVAYALDDNTPAG
jgi:predicted ATPase/transcriptional regulator with XRE-family HTH domain